MFRKDKTEEICSALRRIENEQKFFGWAVTALAEYYGLEFHYTKSSEGLVAKKKGDTK